LFIKDRIKNNEVKVIYCPTEHMLADYYTKALQRSLFNLFRDAIIGYKEIPVLLSPINSKFEERVGNKELIPANL